MNSRHKSLGKRSSVAAEQTKIEILKAALREFSKYGYDATSLRKIAEEAGTTHGLIRHHFGDKLLLYKCVVDFGYEQFISDLEPIFSAIESSDALNDPITLAKKSLRIFARGSIERPELARLILHEAIVESERLEYFYEKVDRVSALFEGLFSALQHAGVMKNFETLKSYTHFIFFNLPIPLSLNKFSSSFMESEIHAEEELEKYLNRFGTLLFGDK